MLDSPSNKMESVGKRVRKLRLDRKLTQQVLADRAGLYHTTISEIERSVTMPNLDTLGKIAKVLDVEPGELITPSADGSADKKK